MTKKGLENAVAMISIHYRLDLSNTIKNFCLTDQNAVRVSYAPRKFWQLKINVFEKYTASLFRAELVLKIIPVPNIYALDYGCPEIVHYAGG